VEIFNLNFITKILIIQKLYNIFFISRKYYLKKNWEISQDNKNQIIIKLKEISHTRLYLKIFLIKKNKKDSLKCKLKK
jgi:hypothetical protein